MHAGSADTCASLFQSREQAVCKTFALPFLNASQPIRFSAWELLRGIHGKIPVLSRNFKLNAVFACIGHRRRTATHDSLDFSRTLM
jgi:hypothetical protein